MITLSGFHYIFVIQFTWFRQLLGRRRDESDDSDFSILDLNDERFFDL